MRNFKQRTHGSHICPLVPFFTATTAVQTTIHRPCPRGTVISNGSPCVYSCSSAIHFPWSIQTDSFQNASWITWLDQTLQRLFLENSNFFKLFHVASDLTTEDPSLFWAPSTLATFFLQPLWGPILACSCQQASSRLSGVSLKPPLHWEIPQPPVYIIAPHPVPLLLPFK